MNLRERIIDHLQRKGTFDDNVDSDMVDDLIEQTAFAKQIFKKLKEEGPVIYYLTTSGSQLSKINPLLNAHQMVMRNIFQLSSKLGINRNDRLKLKIIEKKNQDELDKLLEE